MSVADNADARSATKSPTGSHCMDIGKAKALFNECGGEMVREYESIAAFCRENRIDAPLANGNFLHALTLTDLLFRHTEKSLLMLTGGAGDGFIACLEKTFKAMLGRLRSNKGSARIIIVDGDQENKLLRSLQKDYPGVLQVARATSSGSPISHFIVGDGEMLRDEEPHPQLNDSIDANVIKADVYFHSPNIASIFTNRFDAMWRRVNPT